MFPYYQGRPNSKNLESCIPRVASLGHRAKVDYCVSNFETEEGEEEDEEKEKEKEPGAKRHHMVSDTLAPLYTVYGLKLGCSGATAPIGDEVL